MPSPPLDPKSVIERLTYCGPCAAHDEHDRCEIKWDALEAWMQSVEDRLRVMRDLIRAHALGEVDHP